VCWMAALAARIAQPRLKAALLPETANATTEFVFDRSHLPLSGINRLPPLIRWRKQQQPQQQQPQPLQSPKLSTTTAQEAFL
jgi:hypothetical protein